MIRHIFKLMWNQRRKNGLLFLELFFAFAILFGVFSGLIHHLRNYQSPLGFETENMWVVDMYLWEVEDSAEIIGYKHQLKRELSAVPEVREVSFTNNVTPFSGSIWTTSSDDNGFEIYTLIVRVDEFFKEVAGLTVTQGKWFEGTESVEKYRPIVISELLWEESFNRNPVLDSIYSINGEECKIVGMVDHYKYQGEFAKEQPLTFFYHPMQDQGVYTINLKLGPKPEPEVEEKISQIVSGIVKRDDSTIRKMEVERVESSRKYWIPMTAILSICGFLILNIALGLFGVLWYNINKRKGEIGLRRSMGATQGEISRQFIGELLVITLAALFIGGLFAIQIPLLDVVPWPDSDFYFGLLFTLGLILLLVSLCAFFPSRQAARIHPAEALHEE